MRQGKYFNYPKRNEKCPCKSKKKYKKCHGKYEWISPLWFWRHIDCNKPIKECLMTEEKRIMMREYYNKLRGIK